MFLTGLNKGCKVESSCTSLNVGERQGDARSTIRLSITHKDNLNLEMSVRQHEQQLNWKTKETYHYFGNCARNSWCRFFVILGCWYSTQANRTNVSFPLFLDQYHCISVGGQSHQRANQLWKKYHIRENKLQQLYIFGFLIPEDCTLVLWELFSYSFKFFEPRVSQWGFHPLRITYMPAWYMNKFQVKGRMIITYQKIYGKLHGSEPNTHYHWNYNLQEASQERERLGSKKPFIWFHLKAFVIMLKLSCCSYLTFVLMHWTMSGWQ